jgi:predicted GNAT family N-acyltransferase
MARRLVVFTPNGEQIAALMDKARKDIPMLTSAEVVQRVTSYNPDCFWGVARRDNFDINHPVSEGYFSFLPLTKEGLQGLLDGSLERRNPPLSAIAAQNEKPAAVYIWHVYAPGHLAAGMALACQKMWSLQNRDVDLYSWSIHETAARYVESMGFKLMPEIIGSKAPRFHMFRRSERAHKVVEPTTDFRQSARPKLSARVARTVDDFMRAVALRGAVYIGEQQCPYDEEFDGNDFSATHLIGYVGDEPAGCIRIRYFADFAKIERLVVRKEFRRSGLAQYIVRAGIDLCRSKGYVQICAYAQKRLVHFWSKCGFGFSESARQLVFSDFAYVEMRHISDRKSDAISIVTDPYVVIRPEGNWEQPSNLEKSTARGVRRPSIETSGTVAA